jgi:hypothetical protein
VATRGGQAPATIGEGLNAISAAITQAMMAPDAGPYLQLLDGLQKAVVGAVHGGQKGPPQPGGPGQQGARHSGGGMNLGQLQGQAPSPPSGPEGGPSQSGISADDLRRMTAQQGSMAS